MLGPNPGSTLGVMADRDATAHGGPVRDHEAMQETSEQARLVGAPLGRAFFARAAPRVARALLGKLLVHEHAAGLTVGRIVETEAYDESDPASHSHRGKTARNAVMFGPPGHAYVYFTYGMHWLFNVSCGREGFGAAVLIRALEPVCGVDLMRARRERGKRLAERELCRGPARLVEAMAITRAHNGVDLTRGPLRFAAPEHRPRRLSIAVGPRIGISKGEHEPWRFFVADNPYVSGKTHVP